MGLLMQEQRVRVMQRVISVLRNWSVGSALIVLTACSAPVSVVKPLDVSRANQSASAKFVISSVGEYRFALLFVRGKNLVEMNNQSEIFGEGGKNGVAVPMYIRIVRDGKVFSEENITTNRVFWGQSFKYEGRMLNTAVRLIKTYELPPGTYSVEARTLEAVAEFNNVESYIEFAFYKPKH